MTVRYDSVAALTTRPDGARSLTGLDGFHLTIEPTLYRSVTEERIAAVDAGVPAAARVPLPARDAEQIPRPPEPKASTPKARRPRWRDALRGLPFGLVALVVVDTVFGLGILFSVVHEATAAEPRWSRFLPLFLPTVLLTRYTRRAYHRHRHARG